MTVEELTTLFPEIPADLRAEPALARLAECFDGVLKTAAKPSACSQDHTPDNRAYMKLIGPMGIYGYGLSTREKVLGQIEEILRAYEADPSAFAAELKA